MKIVVDYDLCEGNAVCQKIAPQVFLVDEKDQLQVLIESPGEDLREKVEKAVARCPKAALSLIEV